MKFNIFYKFFIVLYLCAKAILVEAGPLQDPFQSNEETSKDTPLYLSSYIENKKIEEGRKLAEVKDLGWSIKSYSGLLTVNKTVGSNMFFWYLPSECKSDRAPLLLWLNGYSTASTYGLFLQNGPFDLLESGDLKPRNISWQKHYHMLYIDNPIGVGFSTTKSEEGFSTDMTGLGNNLYNALNQFLELFPELRPNGFYITGLSLAGKYAMALANVINQKNKNNSINFKGIFLGNPLLNPNIQASYGEYLLQLGFIDEKQEKEIKYQEGKYLQYQHNRNNQSAVSYWTILEKIQQITGLKSLFDYNSPYINPQHYEAYISRKDVRQALHVGNIPFNDGTRAMSKAGKIINVPVSSIMEKLLEKIDILIYVGQMDIVCNYPRMAKVLKSLNWHGRQGYIDANREKLYDKDDYVWGYKKNYGRLTDVLIRNGSHSVITNQPRHVFELLLNFTHLNPTNR